MRELTVFIKSLLSRWPEGWGGEELHSMLDIIRRVSVHIIEKNSFLKETFPS